MTTHPAPVWIDCSATGCANGIAVYWQHADNFLDRSFYCPEHDSGAMHLEEVPC